MNGKETCRILKQIRRQIAEANGIPLNIAVCSDPRPCTGTCSRCEEEMRQLREALQRIRDRGGKPVIPQTQVEPIRAQESWFPIRTPAELGLSHQLAGVPARRDWVEAAKKKKK